MRRSICLAILALSVLVPANFAAAQTAEDKAIAQQIGRNLKDSGQLRDYRIGVKYQQGVAWLSGSVANEQQLHTAMRLTQGMPGVQRVVNNLSIGSSSAAAGNANSHEQNQPLRQASAQGPGYGQQRANQAYMPPQGAQQSRPMQMQRPQNNRPMPSRPMPNQAMYGQGDRAMQASCNCGPGGMGGGYGGGGGGGMMGPPAASGYVPGAFGGGASYDNASMPGYAWPSYAAYPNYAALSYPRQYSPSAWPYIGPFYPYPQVPLGWRKVSLEWDDGWWFLDFSDCGSNH